MAKMNTSADTYAELSAWMGDKRVKRLGNNTHAERIGIDGTTRHDIGIVLHSTTILTFHDDETMSIDTGGWRTVTTKDRLNGFLPRPLRVWSEDGVWTLSRGGNNPGRVSEVYDGMRFDRHGNMVTDVLVDSGRELKRLKRDIGRYVKLYSDERVRELVENAREHGTAGDCWGCAMVNAETGRADVMGTDHLLEHVAEGYTIASLMVNALRFVSYREEQLPYVVRHGDIVRRAIRRYMVGTLTTSHGARPMANSNPGHFA